MPVVASGFRPPFFLRNGHIQTVLSALLPARSDVVFQRERLELVAGDFLDLGWAQIGAERLAILSHGAPIHGFHDAKDYWEKSSATGYLHGINVPILILNACDDPLLTPESFPVAESEGNPCLFVEMPKWGGHLGFIDLVRGIEPWSEQRVAEFLTANGGKEKDEPQMNADLRR